MSQPLTGLLLSDDLLFGSRITATATAAGVSFRIMRSAADLLAQAAQVTPRCVLLDLQNPGLPIEDTVAQLKRLHPAPTIVAYGSHVDAETLRRARDAGCDVAWPRSKFVEELATALPAWFGVSDATP